MMWNLESILHAFDHQENLDFVAITFWVMTALVTREWELSSVRYAIYLDRRSISGMYVGNTPKSALTPKMGVVVCSEVGIDLALPDFLS